MAISLRDVTKRLACDGVTKTFSLAGLIYLARTDLKVSLLSPVGTESSWTLGAEYTLGGDGKAGTGTLTTSAGDPCADGWQIFVYRDTDDIQNNVFNEGDGFPAKNTESAFDRRCVKSQELSAGLGRSLRLPWSSNPIVPIPPLASGLKKVLVVKEDGSGFRFSDDDYNDQLANVTAQAEAAQSAKEAAQAAAATAAADAVTDVQSLLQADVAAAQAAQAGAITAQTLAQAAAAQAQMAVGQIRAVRKITGSGANAHQATVQPTDAVLKLTPTTQNMRCYLDPSFGGHGFAFEVTVELHGTSGFGVEFWNSADNTAPIGVLASPQAGGVVSWGVMSTDGSEIVVRIGQQ